jgi:hypothetical protein
MASPHRNANEFSAVVPFGSEKNAQCTVLRLEIRGHWALHA